jgi:NAD(P)-dependent dehydrogenase (short-subunit alcohol dehydrogenase family)
MKFADLGCRVACVDIDDELNKETIKLINDKHPDKAKCYKCNVAKMQDIKDLKEAVVRDFGEVNILINNAGIVNASPLLEITESDANLFVSINLTSHVLVSQWCDTTIITVGISAFYYHSFIRVADDNGISARND